MSTLHRMVFILVRAKQGRVEAGQDRAEQGRTGQVLLHIHAICPTKRSLAFFSLPNRNKKEHGDFFPHTQKRVQCLFNALIHQFINARTHAFNIVCSRARAT